MAVQLSSDQTELLGVVADVCRRVQRLVTYYEEGRESGTLDCLVFHVDRLRRLLVAVDDVYNTGSSDVLEGVGMALSFLEELNHGWNESGYVSQILYENVRGRPRLEVKQDQLEYLLHLGFKCPEIGEVLGVSLSAIRRRMSEFGLSVSALYSFITDRELDELVSQIKCEFPNCGYRLLHGHLMSRGQRVSQARIRESLHRVDPEGVAVRWSSAIQRRKYAVLAPLSLWHLDENHKLIRYIHPSIHPSIHTYIQFFCLQGPVRPRLDTAITILQSNTAM